MTHALFARRVGADQQALVLDARVTGPLELVLPCPAELRADVAVVPAGDVLQLLGHLPGAAAAWRSSEVESAPGGVRIRVRTRHDGRPHRVRVGLTFPTLQPDGYFLPLGSLPGRTTVFLEDLRGPGWTSLAGVTDEEGWATGAPVVRRELSGQDRWFTPRQSVLPVLLDWLSEQGDWTPTPTDPWLLTRLQVAPELQDLYACCAHPPRSLSPSLEVWPVSVWEASRIPRVFAHGPGGRWEVLADGTLTGAPWPDLESVWQAQLGACLAGSWVWRDDPRALLPRHRGAIALRTVPPGPRRHTLRRLGERMRRRGSLEIPGLFVLRGDTLTLLDGPLRTQPLLDAAEARWLRDLLEQTRQADDSLYWPGFGTLKLR